MLREGLGALPYVNDLFGFLLLVSGHSYRYGEKPDSEGKRPRIQYAIEMRFFAVARPAEDAPRMRRKEKGVTIDS